jgi:hypothetical protein
MAVLGGALSDCQVGRCIAANEAEAQLALTNDCPCVLIANFSLRKVYCQGGHRAVHLASKVACEPKLLTNCVGFHPRT